MEAKDAGGNEALLPLTAPTASTAVASSSSTQVQLRSRRVSMEASFSNNSSEDMFAGVSSSISSSSKNLQYASLVRQFLASLAFSVFGWNYPRYLIGMDTSILNKAVPFQTTAAGDLILDFQLMQPLTRPDTIPSFTLICTSLYLPFLLIVLAVAVLPAPSTMARIHDWHAGICGLLSAVGLCEGVTQTLKFYIQRRRPNFYALCGFVEASRSCEGTVDDIQDANFSFPSGHSSLAMSTMTFVAWFALGKVVRYYSKHDYIRPLAVLSCLLPWGWALFVGASRLADRWHHPSDVLAGLFLGFACSTGVYHAWYIAAWSVSNAAGIPWSLWWISSKSDPK